MKSDVFPAPDTSVRHVVSELDFVGVPSHRVGQHADDLVGCNVTVKQPGAVILDLTIPFVKYRGFRQVFLVFDYRASNHHVGESGMRLVVDAVYLVLFGMLRMGAYPPVVSREHDGEFRTQRVS